MFDGIMLAPGAKCLSANTQAPFQPGERVLVLFGDTLIPGTIHSVSTPAGNGRIVWNVKTDASGHAYPIDEDFLRHLSLAAGGTLHRSIYVDCAGTSANRIWQEGDSGLQTATV